MPAPPREMDAAEFEELGRLTAKYKASRSEKVNARRFRSHFGVPSDVIACTWELVIESPFLKRKLGRREPQPKHFLWAMMLNKIYSTMPVLATRLQIDEKTLEKWAKLYLEAVAELDRSVVSMVVYLFIYFYYV